MEKIAQELYGTIIKQMGDLSYVNEQLDSEERFEIERIKTIANFFELIIMRQNYSLIAHDIDGEIHKKADIAIQSNNLELENLGMQFNIANQGLEINSAKLDSAKQLVTNNRKKRKLKEIQTSRYREKIEEIRQQLIEVIKKINDIQSEQSKNQQLINSFDNNPEMYIQGVIEQEYYSPEEFIARQLEYLLRTVKDNIGEIILNPGYSNHSLTENGHLNIPLINLVMAYIQTGKSELLDKVRENRECRIEIAKSQSAIMSLNDIKSYFQNDYLEDLKKLKYYSQQLEELKKQKKSIFSNNQREDSITFLEEKIKKFGHKLRSIIEKLGKSNLLEDESFLSLLGLKKSDIVTNEQNTIMSKDDAALKSYQYIKIEKRNISYGNLLSAYSASPQALIAKLDELIKSNNDRIQQQRTIIKNNQTEVPECAQVSYSDLYRLEYYGHITRTKEANQCVKLLESFLQLLSFYKSGEKLNYNQEHFNRITKEIISVISEKMYVSEEYLNQTTLTNDNSPKHYN